MRYELLLQPADPLVPFDSAPLEAALSARGLTAGPSGERRWRLEHGEVVVRPLLEGGLVVGAELHVPLSDRLELIREVVVQGVVLAEEARLRLIDPQLSKELSVRDEGLVADQYLRTARYAGEMLGVSEALYASIQPAPEGLKPGTRLLLLLAGAIALVVLVIEYVL